ncbi:MAG: hypothetical protein CUN55_18525, partial [Phototrophicales bacterium]
MKQWAAKIIIIITAAVTISVGCRQEPLKINEPVEATPSFDEASATATPIVPTPTAAIPNAESIMTPSFDPIYSGTAIQLYSEEFGV